MSNRNTFTARVHTQTQADPPPHTQGKQHSRFCYFKRTHCCEEIKRVMHVERGLWTGVLTIMGFWSHDHLHSPPRHIPVMLLETLPVVYPVDVVGIDSAHN